MKKGLKAFRHFETTVPQIPKREPKKMKQIGFKKSQPANKQTDH